MKTKWKRAACIVSTVLAFNVFVQPVYAWEYLGVEIPDYIDQKSVMEQVEAGNQSIIEQLCVRFGACPVEQEKPNIEDKWSDVGDTSDAFTDQNPKNDYTPPTNKDVENSQKVEGKYDSSKDTDPGVDYTGQLNDMMSNIIGEKNSGQSGYVSNGSSENVYLKWLQNYSGDGGQTFGSTFEASKYFEFLQLARKNEATVKKYNISSVRTLQYDLGDGFHDTNIFTKADGIMSGLDVENIYEIIARNTDSKIDVSALGVSITNKDGETATALKTSIYNTTDIIDELSKFGVTAEVRVSRRTGNFSLTEYMESLPTDKQVVTICYGDNKTIDVKAYVKDSVVLLDAKEAAEALGGYFANNNGSVSVSKDGNSLYGNVNSTGITLSGTNMTLTCPILVEDDAVMISTYSLMRGLGYQPVWDTGEHMLYI